MNIEKKILNFQLSNVRAGRKEKKVVNNRNNVLLEALTSAKFFFKIVFGSDYDARIFFI
jgi:hypothetical protein